MANKYTELIEKQQAEINAFPIYFAANEEEFSEILKKLNLTEEEAKQQLMGVGHGGFILNKDIPAFSQLVHKHNVELNAEICADTTGDGFILDMLCAALRSCNYAATGDPSEALAALSLAQDDLRENPKFLHALELAMREVLAEEK